MYIPFLIRGPQRLDEVVPGLVIIVFEIVVGGREGITVGGPKEVIFHRFQIGHRHSMTSIVFVGGREGDEAIDLCKNVIVGVGAEHRIWKELEYLVAMW